MTAPRALDELGLEDRIELHLDRGGASLEFLEYGDLPGLAALRGAVNAPALHSGQTCSRRHATQAARSAATGR